MPGNSEHAPPPPALGVPRESGWKMKLRKKNQGFAQRKQLASPHRCVYAQLQQGSLRIKGSSRAPLWASGCTCAGEKVTSREVASTQEDCSQGQGEGGPLR